MKVACALLSVSSVVIGLIACGNDSPAEPPATTSTGGATSVSSTTSSGGVGGGVGGSAPAFCANAQPLTPGVIGESAFTSAGERQYFQVDLEPNGWYVFAAIASGAKPPDTVLRLWTIDGLSLGVDDNRYPPTSTNSELLYRVDEGGSHCVEVMEWGTWAGTPGDPATSPYNVAVFPLDSQASLTIDAEPNDDIASAQPLAESSAGEARAVGIADGPDDVDVFSIAKPAGSDWVVVELPPAGDGTDGRDGFGVSQSFGASLLAADGTTVLARADTGSLGSACNPNFQCFLTASVDPAATELFLRLEGPAAPQPGDHYVAVVHHEQYPFTVEPIDDDIDDVNDTPASAIALLPDATTPVYIQYAFTGTLAAGDEDWWLVDGDPGDAVIALSCFSRNQGSGLIGLALEVFTEVSGGAGMPVASDTEVAGHFPLWWDVNVAGVAEPLPGKEPYLLRLAASDVDPTIVSRQYHCYVTRVVGGN